MAAKNPVRLAEILNLKSLEKGGPLGAACAIGLIDGFPIAVAWTRRQKQPSVGFLLRFRSGTLKIDPQALGERLAASNDLLTALGKKPGSNLKLNLTLTQDSLLFFWDYALVAPKPEPVAKVLATLLAAVRDQAQPIGSDCEVCNGRSVGELGCVSGALISVCSGCRERMWEEDRRASEEYAARPSNPMLGTAAGLAAAALCAVLWGVVAYGLERIFLYAGILFGLAIAWTVNKGMGKVNLYGRALTVVLTIVSVLAGDFIFLFLSAADQLAAPKSLALARLVAANFVNIEFSNADGYLSLLFALVGAGFILYANRPPANRREFVRVGA